MMRRLGLKKKVWVFEDESILVGPQKIMIGKEVNSSCIF